MLTEEPGICFVATPMILFMGQVDKHPSSAAPFRKMTTAACLAFVELDSSLPWRRSATTRTAWRPTR